MLAFDWTTTGWSRDAPRTLVDFGPENGCDGITVDAPAISTSPAAAWPGRACWSSIPTGKELAFLPTGPAGQTGERSTIGKAFPATSSSALDDGSGAMLYVTIDKGLYRIRDQTARRAAPLGRRRRREEMIGSRRTAAASELEP